MDGMGARMKARARELGLSDTKVAERAGLSQTRYATYTIDKFEPDLVTLARICRVLQLTPNDLMGWVDENRFDEIEPLQNEVASKIFNTNIETLQNLKDIIEKVIIISAKRHS